MSKAIFQFKTINEISKNRKDSLIKEILKSYSILFCSRLLFIATMILVISIQFPIQAQSKITGSFQWMVLKNSGKCDGNSISSDSLSKYDFFSSESKLSRKTNLTKIKDKDWVSLEISPIGYNNLNELLNTAGLGSGDNPNTVVYAHGVIQSARAQKKVALRVGSDDAIKIWLNGEMVHENPVMRGASDFQEEVIVDLNSGENIILIKVLNCGGGFSLFAGIDAEFTLSGKNYSQEGKAVSYPNAKAEKAFRTARELNTKGKIDEAIQSFEEAESLAPQNGLYSFGYGYDMYHKSKYELAFQKLNSSLEKGYKRPIVYSMLAHSKKKLGDFSSALKYFDQCVELSEEWKKEGELKSNSNMLKDGIAGLFYCEKEKVFIYNENLDFQSSLKILNKIKSSIPDSEDYNIGGSYLRSGIGYIWLDAKIPIQWANANVETYGWLGHYALADGNYDQAIENYNQAIQYSKADATSVSSFKNLELYKYIEISERAKQYKDVVPEYRHKVLSINYNDLVGEFTFPEGTKKKLKNSITEKQKKISILMESLVKRFFEGFSEGKLTFDFEKRIDVQGNLTEYGWKDNTNFPIRESLTPYDKSLSKIFLENIDKYDTFVYYFNGNDIAKNAWGGSHGPIVIPYYNNLTIRGFSLFPSNWISINSFDLFLHEFFHNRDAMNPDPSILHAGHLADGMKKYSEFKGTTQYEYYKWHMLKTPTQFFGKYSYRDKYKDKQNPEILEKFDYLMGKYSFQKFKKNQEIISKANEIKNKNRSSSEAERLYQSVLLEIPEHQDALHGLYQIEMERKNFQKALGYELSRLEYFPDRSAYSSIAIAYRELKQYDQALQYYKKGNELSDKHKFNDWLAVDTLKNTGNLVRDYTDKPIDADYYYDQCIEKGLKNNHQYLVSLCKLDKGILYGKKLGDKNTAYLLVQESIELGYKNDYSKWWLSQFAPKDESVAYRNMKSIEPEMPEILERKEGKAEINE
jgi:tetratricopeptide (TPR) repeat protein